MIFLSVLKSGLLWPLRELHGLRISMANPSRYQDLFLSQCPAEQSFAHSTQLNSMSIYGHRCKTPKCPHLSSDFCISSTTINLIRVLICRRFHRKSYFHWRVHWNCALESIFRQWIHWKCRSNILFSVKRSLKLWALRRIFSEWFTQI